MDRAHGGARSSSLSTCSLRQHVHARLATDKHDTPIRSQHVQFVQAVRSMSARELDERLRHPATVFELRGKFSAVLTLARRERAQASDGGNWEATLPKIQVRPRHEGRC